MSEPLSVEWLDAQLALAAQATEGPWDLNLHSPNMSGRSGWRIRGPLSLGPGGHVLDARMLSGDAEFIAAARTSLPLLAGVLRDILTLCDESEALMAQVWSGMEDYADIGHPKSPTPPDLGVKVAAIRALVERHREGA
jgi:hypothetical protein